MKATYISYSETNSFSPAVISYLAREPKLNPFISYQPNIEGFAQLIENKKVISDRQILVKVLKEQYARASQLTTHKVSLITLKYCPGILLTRLQPVTSLTCLRGHYILFSK